MSQEAAEKEQELDTITVVNLMEGSVKELKDFVNSKKLSKPEIQELLEAEENAKDRKTAVSFLENQLNKFEVNQDVEVVEEEVEDVEERIERMKELDSFEEEDDIEKLEQEQVLKLVGGSLGELKSFVNKHHLNQKHVEKLLEAEKLVQGRDEAVEFLKKQKDKRTVEESVESAEKDVKSLKEDLDKIVNSLETEVDLKSGDEDVDEDIEELSQKVEDEDAADETEGSETEDQDETEESDEVEDSEEDDEETEEVEEKDEDEDNEEIEESEENGDGNTEDGSEDDPEEGLSEEFKQKKEILGELDVELTDDELEDIPLDQLEQMKAEKDHREEMIEDLVEKGMDEDTLRKASTTDLERLEGDLESSEQEEEKDEKEIREEAQEDLEMLMGAVKSGSEEKEESTDHVEELKERFEGLADKFKRSNTGTEDDEDKTMRKDKVLQILDKYRTREDKEAAIKAAHVMKGFLEFQFDIDRELTYKELAENIDADGHHNLEVLVDFFENMHKDQYTGNIDMDMDQIIDASEKTVKELS